MKLSAIDANLLLSLHALLQEASVTRAAKRLGVGQPAMSRSLSRLREQFKDPLLVQRGRQFVLSPGAQALAPSVERAISAIRDVFEERSAVGARRTYVLACADLFGIAVVPALLRNLLGPLGPTVEIRPIAARSTERILEEGVDVALGTFEDVPATVSQRDLFSDSFVCVVRSDHPRIGATMSLKSYLELDHLEVVPAPLARPGLRIERALGAKSTQRRITVRVPYFSLAARILAESDLVMTMSGLFARELQRLAPLKVVAAPINLAPLRFSMIWHRKWDGDRAHEWFRNQVASICTERLGNVR